MKFTWLFPKVWVAHGVRYDYGMVFIENGVSIRRFVANHDQVVPGMIIFADKFYTGALVRTTGKR